jgi:hypothetical protein
MHTTLKELAASDDPGSRGAAALIEAGYSDSTRLSDLTPGSVTRTLAETLARELATVYERLGEIYESAFVETATGDSLETLVDGLPPCRPWWRRLWHERRVGH